MKQSNIVFLLQMTKDFLDGKIDPVIFNLDFPDEVETRYKKMLRENRMIAELIYDCLVEDGAYLYHDLSREAFKARMKEQYEFVDGVYRGEIDLI